MKLIKNSHFSKEHLEGIQRLKELFEDYAILVSIVKNKFSSVHAKNFNKNKKRLTPILVSFSPFRNSFLYFWRPCW